MPRNWARSIATSWGVKPAARRREKPCGARDSGGSGGAGCAGAMGCAGGCGDCERRLEGDAVGLVEVVGGCEGVVAGMVGVVAAALSAERVEGGASSEERTQWM